MNNAKAFYDMLKILFDAPCLIIMLGEWRSGKTDTSLLIAYLAVKWGLIKEIGSNIWTYKNPLVEYITSMGGTRRWLHHNRESKLFILDEALSHLARKRAMSKKNVGVTSGIVPELSKAHGRMIFCSQTDEVDSTLMKSEFCHAVMRKDSKTVMSVNSTLFEPVTFTGIPRSPIQFDKDRVAEFSETETLGFDTLSLEVKCGVMYADGTSIAKIGKDLGLHREIVKRNIRKVLKAFVEREQLEVVSRSESVPSLTVGET